MGLTVGELKRFIADMPDETPVVSRDDNYELRGAITDRSSYGVKVEKFRKEKQGFRDDCEVASRRNRK